MSNKSYGLQLSQDSQGQKIVEAKANNMVIDWYHDAWLPKEMMPNSPLDDYIDNLIETAYKAGHKDGMDKIRNDFKQLMNSGD